MTAKEIISASKKLPPSERLGVAKDILASLLEINPFPKNERVTADWLNNGQYILAELYNTHGLVDFVYSHIQERLKFL